MEDRLTVNDPEIQSIIQRMAVIYGDNVKLIMGKILLVYDEYKVAPKGLLRASRGMVGARLFDLAGNRVIDNEIDLAVPIIDAYRKETIGCAVFEKDSLKELYYSEKHVKLTVISSSLSIDEGYLKIHKYSARRPEMLLKYNYKMYVGIFDANDNLIRFIGSR